jgi:phosphocarrier protein HPr
MEAMIMVSEEVVVHSATGLHLRPAGELAERTSKYHSRIYLTSGNKEASGESLLGLLSLGIKEGTRIKVTCEGMDEDEALKSTVDFLKTLK